MTCINYWKFLGKYVEVLGEGTVVSCERQLRYSERIMFLFIVFW